MPPDGLTPPLSQAGDDATPHHQPLIQDIQGAMLEGRLLAVCGVIGSGQTVTLRRLPQPLQADNRVLVAPSVAVEKHRIKRGPLMTARFDDLSAENQLRLPTQGETRARDLRERVKKHTRPGARFRDEAHDLNGHTLTGRKRLLDVVEDGDGRWSLVLAGPPKRRNDLRRPTMEAIGYRTAVFTLDGRAGSQRESITWRLDPCTERTVEPQTMLTADVLELLATKLRTPWPIQLHLTRALDVGYPAGEQPISADLVENVLSHQLHDLEPTLTRHGDRVQDLGEPCDARPAALKALVNNQLDPTRTAE